MGGRHETPSNRSFYVSVATSTLRTAVIVALLVGGIVVLTQVFPETDRAGLAGGSSPSPSPTATDTPSPGPTESPPVDCADIKGVSIAVFNGTDEPGLAAAWQQQLEDAGGWVFPQEVADAPANVEKTIVYFRAQADKAAAECLKEEFFAKAAVRKLPPEATNVQKKVKVAVYLGPDAA